MGTISIAELEETTVELLPARETLNWWGGVNIANVQAINVALAINAGYGSATAVANQLVVVAQG
jgi:hypothetical protein